MLYVNKPIYGLEFEKEVLNVVEALKAGGKISNKTNVAVVEHVRGNLCESNFNDCIKIKLPGTETYLLLSKNNEILNIHYDHCTIPIALFSADMLNLPSDVLYYFSRLLKCSIYLEGTTFMISEETSGNIINYILTIALNGKSIMSAHIPYNTKNKDIVCTNISAVFANLFICPFHPKEGSTEMNLHLDDFEEKVINRVDKLFTSLFLLYENMLEDYNCEKLSNDMGYKVNDIIFLAQAEGIFIMSLDGKNYAGAETAKSLKKLFSSLNKFKGLPLLNNFTSSNLIKKFTNFFELNQA